MVRVNRFPLTAGWRARASAQGLARKGWQLNKSFAQGRQPRRRVGLMPDLVGLARDRASADAEVRATGPLRTAMALAAATGAAAGEPGRGGWLASAASGG